MTPLTATYGLRNTAICEDVLNFVNKNFYVDDGLLLTTTPEKVVETMKKTQAALMRGEISIYTK